MHHVPVFRHRAWVTSALRLCCLLMAGLGLATVAAGGLILQDSLRWAS